MKRSLYFAIAIVALCGPASFALAQAPGVIVTVNDYPITTFDVDQRLKLNEAIGRRVEDRKQALKSLIDDRIKQTEAKKVNAQPDDTMINKQIDRLAKGSGTDADGLTAKLKGKGVSIKALRDLVAAQIAFSRMLNSLYKVKVDVDPAEVDRKYAEIKRKYDEVLRDPRLRPVQVYLIQEITFPVEKGDEVMAQQLLMARAVEAQQFKQRFKGCNSARSAASGIFNVKIGKTIEADGSKIPKGLKSGLDKAGIGGIIGPGRSAEGIQMVALCGKRSVTPKKPELPPRASIENMLIAEKYDIYEERYMRELRQKAFIDYKDKSFAP
ncbi:SurA N-terminal domain-containing protein [soil metagenome]